MRAVAEIDAQSSAVEFVVVHISNGTERRLGVFELDEGEATRLSRFGIRDESDLDDPPNLREGLMELVFRGMEGQVADEDVVFLLTLLLGCH